MPSSWKAIAIVLAVNWPPQAPAPGLATPSSSVSSSSLNLHTRSRITRLEPPHVVEADVDGDLRGHGKWTLTETETGTHVRFDWQVFADKPLLRVLTPILRPAFRWNHAWAIARAREGLEPYARAWSEERRTVAV
jgi:hypothetical protein